MASGRKECTFLWFIENYSYCCAKGGEWLNSPIFTADELEGTQWYLALYPRGDRVEHKGFMALCLYRWESYNASEYLPIKFELSVLAEDGSVLSSKEYDYSFQRYSECGDDDFLKIDEIVFRRNFPQDILTVRCKMSNGEGMDVERVAPIHARTRIGVEKVSFLQEVNNFNLLEPYEKNTVDTRSPSTTETEAIASSSLYFTFDSCPDGEMIVEITPFFSINFLCTRKISLLDAFGNEILCADDDSRFNADINIIQKPSLSLTRQEILNKKCEYLPDNKLSLKCDCSFSKWVVFEEILANPYEMPKPVPKRSSIQESTKKGDDGVDKASGYPSVTEDMKAAYMKKCLTDVEVKTKENSFPAHKIVLCARSPVFERMLTSDMREKQNNCIPIDDLEEDVVQQFLLFLYSDTVEHLEWEMATRLYYAADKYEVGRLKAVCSSFLIEKLTPTRAGELLLLADTHSDEDLKKSVEEFILKNEEQVFGSKEWDLLMEKNLPLAAETMRLKYKRKRNYSSVE